MPDLDKIQTAANATDAVRQKVDLARHYLTESKAVNAAGVLVSPTTHRRALLAAREKLDEAIALIEAANWPTDADYDQV